MHTENCLPVIYNGFVPFDWIIICLLERGNILLLQYMYIWCCVIFVHFDPTHWIVCEGLLNASRSLINAWGS